MEKRRRPTAAFIVTLASSFAFLSGLLPIPYGVLARSYMVLIGLPYYLFFWLPGLISGIALALLAIVLYTKQGNHVRLGCVIIVFSLIGVTATALGTVLGIIGGFLAFWWSPVPKIPAERPRLGPQLMLCSECGARMPESALYCGNCGKRLLPNYER